MADSEISKLTFIHVCACVYHAHLILVYTMYIQLCEIGSVFIGTVLFKPLFSWLLQAKDDVS